MARHITHHHHHHHHPHLALDLNRRSSSVSHHRPYARLTPDLICACGAGAAVARARAAVAVSQSYTINTINTAPFVNHTPSITAPLFNQHHQHHQHRSPFQSHTINSQSHTINTINTAPFVNHTPSTPLHLIFLKWR